MKIAIIVGTRPEIIKMSPVIRASSESYIIHTGQHYDYAMDGVFFEQLELPEPKYKLNVGSRSPGNQLASIIDGVEQILKKEKTNIVLVLGDTNSVLGGALAASKNNIKIGHIEAGLRSFDRTMPEEINRILTDHCSDLLFAPTIEAFNNALCENIDLDSIHLVGNVIVDALKQNLEIALKRDEEKHKDYCLVTLHRQENVDNQERFTNIMKGLNLIARKLNILCLYPIHPRAEKMMKQFGILNGDIVLMPPRDYLSFLRLENNASFILTDSGGVQEEACIMKVPCVTLRDNTERPETIGIGANRIAGTDPGNILKCATEAIRSNRDWSHRYGDNVSEKILEIVGG
jgi:UDP-N-acetylglucosamine 2-epimerase (non-hydrolysing)